MAFFVAVKSVTTSSEQWRPVYVVYKPCNRTKVPPPFCERQGVLYRKEYERLAEA